MNRRILIASAATLLGLGSLATVVAQSNTRAPAAPAVEQVARARMIAAPGLVEPLSEEREIASELRGRLRAVHVDEGDRVRAGQVIAELENADIAAQVQAAEARVAMREAELSRAQNGARSQERREAEAALADAEATVRLARQELDRRRPLASSGYTSRGSLDQAQSQHDSAVARRAAAAERLSLLNAGTREEEIRMAEAALTLARAEVEQSRAIYQKTIIRAPIDGLILQRLRRAGENVTDQPPTVIVRMGDVSRLNVRAEIDEADIAQIAVGQRVSLRADAYGEQRFAGSITRVGNRLGRKTIRTDQASERIDTKVLEVLIALDPGVQLPVGLRVDVFVEASPRTASR